MRRHRSFKLRWKQYYQYIFEGQIFYLKLKAYTNKFEGLYEWETIKEQTYKNAIKRGYKDNVVIVEENILEVPTQALTLIINEMYGVNENEVRKAICEAQETIERIEKNRLLNSETEYKIFKKFLKNYMQKKAIAI